MAYRIAAFSVLFLISMCLLGQQSKIDSLKVLLELESVDSIKMKILVDLTETEDDSVALLAAMSLRYLAKRKEDDMYLARSYRALGILSNNIKDARNAIKYFDSTQLIFNKHNRIAESIEVEYRRAKIYYYSSNNVDAIKSFKKVLSFNRLKYDTAGIINTTAWLSMCHDNDVLTNIAYSEEGYRLALLINDSESAMMCGNNLGLAYKDMGRPKIALGYYEKVLKIAVEEKNDLYRAYFLENMGVLSSNIGNYREALTYYFKAMEIYEAQNDLEILNDLQINIGVIYKKNREYKKALEAYRKYVDVNLLSGDSSDVVNGYLNIGSVFIEKSQFDSAKYYLKSAYEIRTRIGGGCYGETAGALADLYYQIGELDSALYLYKSALSSIEECENFKILSAVTYGMGLVYKDVNDSNRAFEFFSRSYSSATDSESKLDLQRASEALYRWYKSNGNVAEAMKYLEIFQQTKDSLFNQENTRKLAWLEANYQMDQVSDSLTLVKENEARIFNAKIKDQQRRQTLIIVSTVALIIILIALYLYFRKRRELKYQFSLSEERNASFKAVITATEDERKRIAKDLHDGVVQQIAAVKLTLASVEQKIPKEERDEIVKAKNMAEAAAEETRNLSHQMMPKVLMEVGLVPAVEDVISNLLAAKKIVVDFQQHGLKDRYENRIEIAVYRIFQELVNNIIKHSNAKQVDIQLMENAGKLMLIVEDDGVGMGEEKQDGIGLSNIQSRLTTIDGKVNYESGSASGTVATIVIPL